MAINWPNFNLIHESSKGKAKHKRGSSTYSLDISSHTKQTVPSVQLVQMEEGRRNSLSANNNVLANPSSGSASQCVVSKPSNEGGEQGETIVQGETDGVWKSNDPISVNKRVSTSSSNSNLRAQISEAAMKLSPRSLTKKIDEMISEIESFQQKDDLSSRLSGISEISKNGFRSE